ncbi:Uncharacterised protein [Bordetella pertussis]|nr:Uncharacterised protein [Bordetella pertussis]
MVKSATSRAMSLRASTRPVFSSLALLMIWMSCPATTWPVLRRCGAFSVASWPAAMVPLLSIRWACTVKSWPAFRLPRLSACPLAVTVRSCLASRTLPLLNCSVLMTMSLLDSILPSLSNPPREVTVISLPAVNVPGLETLAATIVAASLTCILPALRAAPEVVSVALLAMTSAPVSLSNDAAVTVTPSRTFRLPVLDTAPPALTCNGPIRRILLEKRVSCREVRFAAPPRWVTCAASAMASAETV